MLSRCPESQSLVAQWSRIFVTSTSDLRCGGQRCAAQAHADSIPSHRYPVPLFTTGFGVFSENKCSPELQGANVPRSPRTNAPTAHPIGGKLYTSWGDLVESSPHVYSSDTDDTPHVLLPCLTLPKSSLLLLEITSQRSYLHPSFSFSLCFWENPS